MATKSSNKIDSLATAVIASHTHDVAAQLTAYKAYYDAAMAAGGATATSINTALLERASAVETKNVRTGVALSKATLAKYAETVKAARTLELTGDEILAQLYRVAKLCQDKSAPSFGKFIKETAALKQVASRQSRIDAAIKGNFGNVKPTIKPASGIRQSADKTLALADAVKTVQELLDAAPDKISADDWDALNNLVATITAISDSLSAE